MIILINGIFYCFYGYLTYCCFENITPLSFTIIFYVAPLLINAFFSVIYAKKGEFMRARFVSPVFSAINYVLLGFISQINGLWAKFVSKYTVDANDISISVASSMTTLSQIAFIILLYFGINYLFIAIIKAKRSEERA